MLKHPDPEVHFLVEMLESQRDQAMAQAAAHYKMVQELKQELNNLSSTDKSIKNDI